MATVKGVQEDKGLGESAITCGVPVQTLQRRMVGKVDIHCCSGVLIVNEDEALGVCSQEG